MSTTELINRKTSPSSPDASPPPIHQEKPSFESTNHPKPGDSEASPSRPTIAVALRRVLEVVQTNMKPERELGTPPSAWQGLRAIITMSYLNILLICIPVSWALHFVWQNNTTSTQDTIIFVFSFLSIVPLAKLLAFSTDELSCRVGQTLAGLLNATLGNAVELIVSIIALVKCELQIVQSSLVGSILSNLLLVLGMCFFAGGTKFSEQGFGVSATQLNSSLLTVSVIAVLLPAAFHFSAGAVIVDSTEGPEILAVSHGSAIILLFIYLSYLVFQLFSHKNLYNDSTGANFQSTAYPKHKPNRLTRRFVLHKKKKASDEEKVDGQPTAIATSDGEATDPAATSSETHVNGPSTAEEEEEDQPLLSVSMTIALLVFVTVIVAVTAEFLVDSIDGLTDTGHISKEFVGLVLLPIVGNAAEHVTAVTVSVKDKLDLSLGVAVGSSIQIALFVIPFVVVLGWIIGKPLTLLFDPYESIVLFLSVLVVNYTVADGKSNWLEGMILMCLYLMLAVTFWYYPGVNISQQLAQC
ncbi:hypothetical protein PHLGIDRAFT_36633 [Phlebiopsis gigantea 11061_1 CR5-6]|uniref:Sodium/calcium exchanger membrane region domain-containing protein n=1 Tax=Phlebiopsis gigantea (strain 11061_1 CR5-6) TaxID=745531 RepID=A0A0C3RV16_PHLG1|nr:hypothetical protein PHLGIDRAFT_36633 [Phlebiopsis gigantea 11061_1 CR5-6]